MPRKAIIRASEVGEYVYCARSWWLRRAQGLEPEGAERRAHGTIMHERHGRAVAASSTLFFFGAALLLLAAVLLLFSFLHM